MGLLKQARENGALREARESQEAWDEGRLAYVYRANSGGGHDKGLTADVDQILRVGWKLHSTAMTMNTTLANTEIVVFVFVR
jgi:hypothetical protein